MATRETFQASVGGDDCAEMLTAESGVATIHTLVANEFSPLSVDSRGPTGGFGISDRQISIDCRGYGFGTDSSCGPGISFLRVGESDTDHTWP